MSNDLEFSRRSADAKSLWTSPNLSYYGILKQKLNVIPDPMKFQCFFFLFQPLKFPLAANFEPGIHHVIVEILKF